MRKLVSVLVLVLAMVVVSSCAYFPTTVKNKEILANFHERVSKLKLNVNKVGNPNIRFYVNILDQRKGELKNAFTLKTGLYGIGLAHVYAENLDQTIKYVTEYALKQAGWGVAESPDGANYVMTVRVLDFYRYNPSFSLIHYNVDVVCIVSKDNSVVFKKRIYYRSSLILWDTHSGGKWKNIEGYLLKLYYERLVKILSSQEFKNAVEGS